ncbi:MAG: hypothetical protein AB8U26_03090 [Rickettsiales endosymbiont of Dermacentor nuttalli]
MTLTKAIPKNNNQEIKKYVLEQINLLQNNNFGEKNYFMAYK